MQHSLSNDPLRVANVLLDPRFGGPQNCALQIALALKSTDIEMTTIMSREDSEFLFRKMKRNGIYAVRFGLLRRPSLRPFALITAIAAFIPGVIRLAYFLRRNKVEVITVNGVTQITSVLAGKLAGARVLLVLHDTVSTPLFRGLFAVLSPMCDGYIVVSRRTKETYFSGINSRWARKPVFEIPAPVDTTRFKAEAVDPSIDILNACGISITTLGSVNPDKGLEYFIEMARLLKSRHHSISFNIVGPIHKSQAVYANRLSETVKRSGLLSLKFIGASDNVPAILKATDIYVCSSLSEASPMSVWEAMSMELAVVSTNVGDVARYISDGKEGFVVPVADANALAEKVSLLINSEILRSKFGQKARSVVLNELDIGICASKHRAVYHEIGGN